MTNSMRNQIHFCLLPVLMSLGFAASSSSLAEPLSSDMRAEFGAATWIPEDAGYFLASYRYREQWLAFTKTNAYQELLTLPVVQMGLEWIKQQPYLDQLAAMRAQYPLLDDGIKLLKDAFSQEVFIYVDSRGPGFINEVGGLYNSLLFSGFIEGFNQSTGAFPEYTQERQTSELIGRVVAAEQELRVPGIVFGFRLSDVAAGKEFLANLALHLQKALPLPLQEVTYGDGKYLTLAISAEMFLTPQAIAEIEAEFGQADIDPATADRFIEFIKSQTLMISLGMRGNYLLISVGADNSHLESLGRGVSLAESESFAPLRRHFRKRLIGLSYVHRNLTRYGKIDVDANVTNLQHLLLQTEEHLPTGLSDRLIADATQLLNEINESLPAAQPEVEASFWQDGIEYFSFSAMLPGSIDSSEPLSILAHTGESPLLVVAGHAPSSLKTYDRLVHWIKRFYGYFEDFAVPKIPEDDRAEFEQFEALALPAFRQIHSTTRELLLPSLDGGQSLFVLDDGGVFDRSPDTKQIISLPIRFPRPSMVMEVNDEEKFQAAWTQYRETFNSLMIKIAKINPDVSLFQLPRPASRRVEDATLYSYPIPPQFDPSTYMNNDFEPHALLNSKHLVLSLSSQHSKQCLTSAPIPKSAKIDFTLPAGRAVWFDNIKFKDLLCDDAEAILALVEAEQSIDRNTKLLIILHINKLRKALSAVRSYRSRTYEENGLSVTHGWLHLQDIE